MMLRTGVIIAATGFVAACGGGSADESACAPGAVISVTTTWSVTGGQYNPPPYRDTIVVGRVGTALSAKPVHTGIPAGCVGKGVYSTGNSLPLPPGLSLNPSTGEVSGIPTAKDDFSGGGTSFGAVRLTIPGFSVIKVLDVVRIE
jgi:hypothetical protein